MSESTVQAVTDVPIPPPPPNPPTPSEPTGEPESQLRHTPGGIPVVPLALSAANTTVALVGGAALAAGPLGAVVAATGTAAAAGIAAARATRGQRAAAKKSKATAVRSGRTTTAAAGRGVLGAVPAQRRSRSSGSSSSARSGKGLGGGRAGRGRSAVKSAFGSTGLTRTARPGSSRRSAAGASSSRRAAASGASSRAGRVSLSKNTPARAAGGAARTAGGRTAPRSGRLGGRLGTRVGQVQAARAAARKAAPTRQQARLQGAADRRAVSDTRRANAARRTAARTASKSTAGRLASGLLARAGRLRDAAVSRGRAVRDRRTDAAVSAKRMAVRKAPARRRARAALRRSAARFHGRRLLAALLAFPVGLLGLVLTPLGRRLGLPWLMYLGRRLYWRITGEAARRRAQRDQAIRKALAEEEAAIDREGEQEEIGDTAARPEHPVPTTAPTADQGGTLSGFQFDEHAAEMEQAAASYEPEGCMEILAMVENLPDALQSVANIMRILAERADSEFPLEKEVAEGFQQIHEAMLMAVSTAEDLGPTFRRVHEQDIARHEDPRNGPEAEKGWNV